MKITPVSIALSQIGIREEGGRNRGPMVDEYIRSVGLDPTKGGVKGYAWCAAFVFWAVREAHQRSMWEQSMSGPAQLPIDKTAWVWDLLKNKDRLCAIKPGCVFVMSHSTDPKLMPFKAHTGFVVDVHGDTVETVEGNTDGSGGREGDGVYRKHRNLSALHKFLDVET